MRNPWLHRLAIIVAAGALLLLVSGALLTDYAQVALPHPASDGFSPVYGAHEMLGWLTAALTLALAIGLTTAGGSRWLAVTGWIAFAAVAGEGALGRSAIIDSKAAGTFHALIAQFLFAAMVMLVVGTSQRWLDGPDPVFDQGWPSLRFLGNAMLLLVLMQVSLGAAFRHKASGLLPHLVGAMVVALWILIVCMFVMQQFPEHPSLRPAANFLLAVTLAQVFLGIAALTMRMLSNDNTPALLASTAGHVTTGALTLAASAILTFQIRRNVLPKPVIEEAEEAGSSS